MHLIGMLVLALAPIIWLVIALSGLHMEAYKASFGAFIVAAVCAVAVWGMEPLNLVTAALEGFAMAIWPIVIVIIAAVFTYNLTVHTGAMETIKQMLCSVSADRRVLTLLIAWCFGNFLEGMAGFGTAVAIPSSMLMALGIDPVTAILSCLIANGMPTMFGSIGIPTTTLAAITGIDVIDLGFTQTMMSVVFVLACPFLMVMLVRDGKKALHSMVPIALIAGVSFAIPEILAARFIGAELPDVVGSVVSLIATFTYAFAHREQDVPKEQRLEVTQPDTALAPVDALRAWTPFILIFCVLLLTSKLIPLINEPLSQFKTTVNIYRGDPLATLTFSWINTPGVLIFFCGVIGGFIQSCSLREMLEVLGETCKQMAKTVATMLGVLACAKIMGYSGMIATIAAFLLARLVIFIPWLLLFLERLVPLLLDLVPQVRCFLGTFSFRLLNKLELTQRGLLQPILWVLEQVKCFLHKTLLLGALHAT